MFNSKDSPSGPGPARRRRRPPSGHTCASCGLVHRHWLPVSFFTQLTAHIPAGVRNQTPISHSKALQADDSELRERLTVKFNYATQFNHLGRSTDDSWSRRRDRDSRPSGTGAGPGAPVRTLAGRRRACWEHWKAEGLPPCT